MAETDKTKILVVDDLPENLLAYRAILDELGQEIIAAHNGEEALRQVLQHEFAVVLLDVNMPGMDGFEAATLIRQRKKSAHTPIIFVTAFADELRATQGYARGAVDYMRAPVVPEVLRAKVKVFVDLFRMTEQVRRQTEERIALVEERSKREAAEEANRRLSFLAHAGTIIGQSLDYLVTARDVVRMAVPVLAELALVAQKDPTTGTWQVIQATVRGEQVLVDELTGLESLPPRLAESVERAMQSGIDILDVAPAPQSTGADPAIVVLPLHAQWRTVAVLGLSREPSCRSFSAADVSTAQALASRAAIALDNARLYKDVEHADRQKNEFLSMLAHELRNPLAPIRTAVDMLRLRPQDQPEVIWARDVIDRQVTHLVRLVDDLLDVSRITRGKIRLEMEPLDVADAVADAIETSRPLIEASRHMLTVSLPEEPLWVGADRARLAQVLGNLLNNAAKYTPDGGTITLSARRAGQTVELRVRDSGMGIPHDMLGKVFDLFTQVDRSIDRSQGGLGIGLTLVRRLVELHGGSVEAASEGPGRGSEFIIRLPALSLGGRRTPAGETSRAARAPAAPLRILVVDDNLDAADGLARLLKMTGHQVQTANDGPAAIEQVSTFQPEVVILDLGLPELNGYEVARRLRANPATREVFLIALSGYSHEEHRRQSLSAGIDRYFVKPLDFDALMNEFALLTPRGTPELQTTGTASRSDDPS